MNASMVRSLIRMGLAVGAHLEHPVSLQQIDGISCDLARPVVDALAGDEVGAKTSDPRCHALSPRHGRCVCWAGHEHTDAAPGHLAADGFGWSV